MADNIVVSDKKTLGEIGEEVAANFLRRKGVAIRARNFRVKNGEIDIIGDEEGTLLFVEVKTRTGEYYGRAAGAVNFRKQQKIIAAAQIYLQRENLGHCPCRFDVIEVYPERDGTFRVVHLPAAFEA